MFEPFANLAYVSLHSCGFKEEGGAAALHAHGQGNDTTFTLGIRAPTGFDLNGTQATMRGMLGWRHAFGDTTPLSTRAFADSDAFTITGTTITRDAAVVEAGLDLALTPAALTLGISYRGQIAADTSQHGIKANFIIRF